VLSPSEVGSAFHRMGDNGAQSCNNTFGLWTNGKGLREKVQGNHKVISVK